MAGFKTIREAKDYLTGKIAAEAEREGAPLTEVERKMLYLSETDWTLPDMKEVSEEFDRDFDQGEYELKIGRLVREIEARDEARSGQELEAWDEAVLKLCDGDHYLLGMIDEAHFQKESSPSRWGRLGPWLPTLDDREPRKPGDLKRLILVALAFGAVLLLAIVVVAFLH